MKLKRTWLDRAIGVVSPSAELKRVRSRAAVQLLARSYEGASKGGRRTANWTSPTTDSNAALAGSLATLRARSRDLVRNNPWADRAVEILGANAVGNGIIPQADRASPNFKTVENLWIDWGDQVICDADERFDFYGLQNLVMRTVVESGACLVRRRRRRANDNLPIPMQLQVLEPDFLDKTRDTLIGNNGNRIIEGIEFDKRGRRVAYWLYREHPGSNLSWSTHTSVRVPAEDILHVYNVLRPGQVDGVPWGSPCIIRMRDLDEYEDAHLLRQKIAACFTAFVHDSNLDDLSNDENEQDRIDRVEPGMIEYLSPGKSVTFGDPPAVQGYKEHTSVSLQSIAAGFGITYEALTGDYSNVNFSSGRMGWLEFHRNIGQWQNLMLIPHLCKRTWQWFNEAAVVSGRIREPARAKWTPPRREMIDPVKETEAIKRQIRNGLLSPQEAIRMFGMDVDDVLKEYIEFNKKIDDAGLKFDSDPRYRTNIGYTPGDEPTEENPDNPDDSQQ